MSKVYFPLDHTADEWRAMAAESRQRSADSFERSDTDGFLSQWASDTTARLYGTAADIAEKGGTDEFYWLFTADGEMVEDWAEVKTRYGLTIRVGRGDDVRWFNESSARKGERRLNADKAKGFVWGLIRTEAVVFLGGGGTGMAGALTVHPVVKPKRDAVKEVVTVVNMDHYRDRD